MLKNSIIECIGNTPLVKIDEKIHWITGLEIFAKCEFLNPFGSVKDRTALGLLQNAGDATEIIESSSGNTAKALGVLAGISGKKFTTITNRIKQKEIEEILQIIWMEIENLPPGSECPDPNDPNSPFAVIKQKMEENPWKYYWTDQYTNEANPAVHKATTAVEIERDLGNLDYFFGGLGTTGTTMWVAKYFQQKNTKIIGIITAPKSYLPGIRNVEEMREVGLFEPELYSAHESVDEQSAIDAMLLLIRKCGLLVGPTSGASFAGMLNFFHKQKKEDLQWKKAVFIACDRLEPYTWYLKEKRPSLFGEEKNLLQNFTKKSETKYTKELSNNQLQIVIDMRSNASYEIAHIRGSLNFPFAELQKYFTENYLPFPKESELVFVCPFGEESEIVAQLAENLGYNATSLANGFLGYKKSHPEHII